MSVKRVDALNGRPLTAGTTVFQNGFRNANIHYTNINVDILIQIVI